MSPMNILPETATGKNADLVHGTFDHKISPQNGA